MPILIFWQQTEYANHDMTDELDHCEVWEWWIWIYVILIKVTTNHLHVTWKPDFTWKPVVMNKHDTIKSKQLFQIIEKKTYYIVIANLLYC